MKNRLLFLNDPKAAPVLVTCTRLKKSGMTTRSSSGMDVAEDEPFRDLVERVKREREKENEFHGSLQTLQSYKRYKGEERCFGIVTL